MTAHRDELGGAPISACKSRSRRIVYTDTIIGTFGRNDDPGRKSRPGQALLA